ncbi:hypothetical protein PRIPAC_82690 [Pristionchus pacificus]|uniref:Uncharacterized protein n=1 Tax=Pristionchus pacificus TaxID=54126 RepID=A0A2A6CMG6_PRIPA|nr:hypothetical protein PRIPAC_82690 [Pristionchus pacificus]|eukprot:PDM79296.1 hypothetical protein PRIPAC_31875 [Pristionchus pacificus]
MAFSVDSVVSVDWVVHGFPIFLENPCPSAWATGRVSPIWIIKWRTQDGFSPAQVIYGQERLEFKKNDSRSSFRRISGECTTTLHIGPNISIVYENITREILGWVAKKPSVGSSLAISGECTRTLHIGPNISI